ncbi:MAG TPA: hypothetical protein VJ698_00455 [Noviherbaspirillum sp.]|uniref:hypothetical protein n=1 Tax=Noviherbaspirillum sp. TaxID=1926288 RepID=UPI002B480F8F|nr:hypothetical protein [Noviherbaspirillum sp.]HJV83916.1 hypothetical protein [Noviherbaspirillum sp.]
MNQFRLAAWPCIGLFLVLALSGCRNSNGFRQTADVRPVEGTPVPAAATNTLMGAAAAWGSRGDVVQSPPSAPVATGALDNAGQASAPAIAHSMPVYSLPSLQSAEAVLNGTVRPGDRVGPRAGDLAARER